MLLTEIMRSVCFIEQSFTYRLYGSAIFNPIIVTYFDKEQIWLLSLERLKCLKMKSHSRDLMNFVTEINEAKLEDAGYVLLSDIYKTRCLNVLGLVKSSVCRQQQSGRFSAKMSIVDWKTGWDNPVQCYITMSESRKFTASKGNVVRLRRIGCNGDTELYLYGNTDCFGFSVDVWCENCEQSLSKANCWHGYCPESEFELEMIEELHEWYKTFAKQLADRSSVVSNSRESFMTLNEFSAGNYGNAVVQIVASGPSLKNNGWILRVWDGSSPATSFKLDIVNIDGFAADEELSLKAENFAADVFLYDEHCTVAKALKPGDFVILYNLHLYYPYGGKSSCQFTMHSGNSYGRRVQLISADDELVKSVKINIIILMKITNEFYETYDTTTVYSIYFNGAVMSGG
ncbi:Protection of telomeres protein 1 [Trichinella murrelli]|uniref:Protection of telomeres protein 1 n=1 Tax=Trichinella murrelli TaxID=144512 RepID=A0A0V0UG70_9BILA|nr:Protection of telomeres protein 1 [Trichinella murrelli]